MQIIFDHDLPRDRDLAIDLHPPALVPDDPEAWIAGLVGGTVLAAEEATTELGWPCVLVRGGVAGASGELVEHRVAACYRFLHLVAAAVVRAEDAARLDAELPAFATAFRTGRPDSSGDIVALAHLWLENGDRA